MCVQNTFTVCSGSGICLYSLLTPTSCLFDRSSVDEEVAPLDDGPSDDDILANTSDEEDDSSSISSKGDPEQREESPVSSRTCLIYDPGSDQKYFLESSHRVCSLHPFRGFFLVTWGRTFLPFDTLTLYY